MVNAITPQVATPSKFDIIPLVNTHEVALVDPEDTEHLMQFTWYLWSRKNYALGRFIEPRSSNLFWMHRVIMREELKVAASMSIDHKDGNGLNNRRCNLRLASQSQNLANQKMQTREKSSKYKGVTWLRKNKKWKAQIKINQNRYYIGSFTDEIEAALAYDERAIKAWGEYANTNF